MTRKAGEKRPGASGSQHMSTMSSHPAPARCPLSAPHKHHGHEELPICPGAPRGHSELACRLSHLPALVAWPAPGGRSQHSLCPLPSVAHLQPEHLSMLHRYPPQRHRTPKPLWKSGRARQRGFSVSGARSTSLTIWNRCKGSFTGSPHAPLAALGCCPPHSLAFCSGLSCLISQAAF